MDWYLKVLKQYADFNGRARRKEYWMFTLFNIIFYILAMLLDYIIGSGYSPIYGIYLLAVLIPNLAVSVRRLHDIGKSGVMMFLAFLPIIGAIWLLILFVTEGEEGENEYGPDPKEDVIE
jgi:uncharacterized membrane protein YhaH (DUF805 family)